METILVIQAPGLTRPLVPSPALAEHFQLDTCTSIKEAQHRLAHSAYAAILVEHGLVDGTALDFLKLRRETPQLENNLEAPVIILAHQIATSERVRSFELDASDVLVGPIDPEELLARLRVRMLERQRRPPVLRFQNLLTLKPDLQHAFLHVDQQERNLRLTHVEFRLLSCLLSQPDRIWTREELLQMVWGKEVYVGDRSIDVHMSNLRRKLGPAGRHLRSVYGVGYCFSSRPRGKAPGAKVPTKNTNIACADG